MEENDCHGDDWELAHRSAAGEEAAYAVIIERYQGPVHSFIYRFTGDVETSRDLTQDVFVKAWFALPRLREEARFSTWLFQIAANLCRDWAKSKATRNARLNDSIERDRDDGQSEAHDLPDAGVGPDRQLESKEAMTALQSAIGRLPVELREAFLLGAVEQRPHKEISTILGISPKAVELRIYRARQLLAGELSGRGIIRS